VIPDHVEIQVHKVQEGILDPLGQEERLASEVLKGTPAHEANEARKDKRVKLVHVEKRAIQLPSKALSG